MSVPLPDCEGMSPIWENDSDKRREANAVAVFEKHFNTHLPKRKGEHPEIDRDVFLGDTHIGYAEIKGRANITWPQMEWKYGTVIISAKKLVAAQALLQAVDYQKLFLMILATPDAYHYATFRQASDFDLERSVSGSPKIDPSDVELCCFVPCARFSRIPVVFKPKVVT